MGKNTLDARADVLAQQIAQGFGTRGTTLEANAAKAGHALPKHVRRDIHTLTEAQALSAHPKLARRVDAARVDKAYRNASGWLGTVDRSARRKATALGVMTEIGFRIFVVLVLFLVVLVWRDLI